jgi:hypothetical protein
MEEGIRKKRHKERRKGGRKKNRQTYKDIKQFIAFLKETLELKQY